MNDATKLVRILFAARLSFATIYPGIAEILDDVCLAFLDNKETDTQIKSAILVLTMVRLELENDNPQAKMIDKYIEELKNELKKLNS